MSERVFGCGDDSSKTAYAQTGTFGLCGTGNAGMYGARGLGHRAGQVKNGMAG